MVVHFLFVKGLLGECSVKGLAREEFGSVGEVQWILGVLWYVFYDVFIYVEIAFCENFCLYYLG